MTFLVLVEVAHMVPIARNEKSYNNKIQIKTHVDYPLGQTKNLESMGTKKPYLKSASRRE